MPRICCGWIAEAWEAVLHGQQNESGKQPAFIYPQENSSEREARTSSE